MSEDRQPWEVITDDGEFSEPEFEEDLESDNEETPEYSEVELTAMEKGWVPQEQWNGNPDDWRPAKEYMDRSSFFERIKNQNNEISTLRRDLELAKEHLYKIRKSQVDGSKQTLEAQKIEALEEGDYRRVSEIDNQLRAVEQEVVEEPQQAEANPEESPEFIEWLSDNPWYNNDRELRMDADAFGISFRQNNPEATAQQVFDYVSKKVRQTYPDKFGAPRGTPQTRSPGTVTAPQNNKSAKATYRDLSEEQLRAGRRFVKLGVFSDIQEYVDDLMQLGEL